MSRLPATRRDVLIYIFFTATAGALWNPHYFQFEPIPRLKQQLVCSRELRKAVKGRERVARAALAVFLFSTCGLRLCARGVALLFRHAGLEKERNTFMRGTLFYNSERPLASAAAFVMHDCHGFLYFFNSTKKERRMVPMMHFLGEEFAELRFE